MKEPRPAEQNLQGARFQCNQNPGACVGLQGASPLPPSNLIASKGDGDAVKVFQATADALKLRALTRHSLSWGDANQNLIVDLAERRHVGIVNCRLEQSVLATADGCTRFGNGKIESAR